MSRARIGVLLVEDNLTEAQNIQGLLAEASRNEPDGPCYELTPATSLAQALEILPQGGVNVVLLDLTLPDCVPLEVVPHILVVDPSLPVLILLERDDEALVLQGIQAGAQDFWIKDSTDSDLLSCRMRLAPKRRSASSPSTPSRCF